ncbi:MAG TPA: L,D-transpeptidase family protein [Longimicrobium sp.]|nr:L,D-transpeptidase family protein [Longimicrobium sp.]
MRVLLAALLMLAMLTLACAPAARAGQVGAMGNPLGDALQVVVVTTADWNAVDAELRRYERASPAEPWRAVGEPVRAAVGRTGLAWGTGLHRPGIAAAGDPIKREGDGKAPAGIFRLGSAFGYAPAAEAAWVRLPYHPTDAGVECVDDSGSRHYNRRVDRDTIAQPDWTSHEELRRNDQLYRWGVWVDHNSDPPVPQGGSCIFLHVWAGPGVATSGCTAMAEADLTALLAWLDPAAGPLLVQLPRGVHEGLRGPWALP